MSVNRNYALIFVLSLLSGAVIGSNGVLEDGFTPSYSGSDSELSSSIEEDMSVIMISIETLRADHMPCYGYRRNTSPALCNFAEQNIQFKDSIAQATWTIPSEASVFTSQYPSVHGMQNRSDRIPESKELLAESLPENYEKVAFTGGMDINPRYGFDQGFDRYEVAGNAARFNKTIPPAKKWLEENKDENFFLFIQGYDPHSPYSAPEPYKNKYAGNYSGKLDNYTIGADIGRSDWILDQLKRYPGKNYAMEMNGRAVPLSEEDVNYTIDRYDGEIRYTDEVLGSFLEDIERMGVKDDTVIIIYSNHGEALNDHVSPGYYINGHRRAPFKEQVNVPLLVHIPGVENKTVEGPVELIDIYPTILDILGVEPSQGIQGESLLNAIESEKATGPVFSEGSGIESDAVITKDWKYLQIPDYYGVEDGGQGKPKILYNRSAKGNKENLYSEFSDIGKEMEGYLEEWKFSNIQFKRDTEAESVNPKDDSKETDTTDVNVSSNPPKFWRQIDRPPYLALKPNHCDSGKVAMGRVISSEFEICINEAGFRDKSYDERKPKNTYRIIALGDAVTFGVGVNNSQTWPSYLERKLNKDKSRNFQVLNFGLPFKSTSEEVEWFKINGTDHNPDLLILQYMENDAENLTRISEIEDRVKKNLSDNLSEAEKNKIAITRAIELEREERKQMSIEEEMQTVDPYLNQLDNMSDEKEFEVLVMYYATQFSERHLSYIRDAAEKRDWYFMVSDLDNLEGDFTYPGTFNLRPIGHEKTAYQVEKKLEEDVIETDLE